MKPFAQLLRIRSQIPLTSSTLPTLSGILVGEGAVGPGLIDFSPPVRSPWVSTSVLPFTAL